MCDWESGMLNHSLHNAFDTGTQFGCSLLCTLTRAFALSAAALSVKQCERFLHLSPVVVIVCFRFFCVLLWSTPRRPTAQLDDNYVICLAPFQWKSFAVVGRIGKRIITVVFSSSSFLHEVWLLLNYMSICMCIYRECNYAIKAKTTCTEQRQRLC